MTPMCAFCGGEMNLPHWCLIERRDREDAAVLAQAFAEEAAAQAKRDARRAFVNQAAQQTRLVDAMNRVPTADSLAALLEGKLEGKK